MSPDMCELPSSVARSDRDRADASCRGNLVPVPTAPIQPQQNLETVMQLEREALEKRSVVQRIADHITAFAGSTPFVVFHLFWFGGWLLVNTGLLPGVPPFDRPPFSLLTLIVSLEAIFLTLLVLMSQNHMMREADKRTHLDLQVNMLAEQEGTATLRMLRRICARLGIEVEEADAVEHLETATDVDQLAKSLERTLPE